MQIDAASTDPLQLSTPLLVLPLYANAQPPAVLAALYETADWTGKFRQTLLLYPNTVASARRVLLLGLGPQDALPLDRLRELGAVAAQRASELRVESFAMVLPALAGHDPAVVAQALAEGALLGTYRFAAYRKDDSAPLAALKLLGEDAAAITAAAERAMIIARGVKTARDLVNRPPNDLTPMRLAEAAQIIGAAAGMPTNVRDLAALRAQGFGGVVAVGGGSDNPPCVIVMEYGTAQPDQPTICLVGKGITFDSGGISIKPADKMDEMKGDMSGAAAVLGAMQAIAELKLPLHVVGLVGAAENLPSATAYRPGDIVTTLSGKTIEILNTDAEGRVVLADLLTLAQRSHPAAIIDLATLTGAAVVALGTVTSGLVCNDDRLAERLYAAGEQTGEHIWRLPLRDAYRDMVKSEIADVKNSTGRYGGAITAGAFLETFVGDIAWAHLDIAGTFLTDAKPRAYTPRGATGVGVRLLVEALRNW